MKRLLFFTMCGCSACKALKPIVEKEAPEKGVDVKFVDCDSDEGIVMCEDWHVRNLPTLIMVDENGNEVKRAVGNTAWKEINEK